MGLPTYAQTHRTRDDIAIAKILQAGIKPRFAIERIFAIRPIIGSTQTDTTTQALVTAHKAHTRNIHLGRSRKSVIKVSDTVDVHGHPSSLSVEPFGIPVYGKAKPPGQIVIVLRRNTGVECVLEVIETDCGIGKLSLWGERPAFSISIFWPVSTLAVAHGAVSIDELTTERC